MRSWILLGSGCMSLGDYDAHYAIDAADAGHALRFRVTATNDGGRRTAYSALYPIRALGVPVATTPPSVRGSVTMGKRLTASPGEWTNDPSFGYQWQRCDAAGACADIANATGATYATGRADAERRIRVVTAANAAGHATATSAATAPIDDDPYNLERPSTSGTPGDPLRRPQFGYRFRWQRCDADGANCVEIPGQPNSIFAADHEVVRADLGHRLRLEVRDITPDGTVVAHSELTEVVTR